MEQATFNKLRDIIFKESGISLSDQKRMLMQNRISKRLRELQLRNVNDYLQVIELDVKGKELIHLIDAISTNHTYFFRESAHFELLAELLPQWEAQGDIKLWCAAASSGEEPYTLAACAAEYLRNPKSFRLLATDICTPVLETAMRAIYKPEQFRDMPMLFRRKYFKEIRVNGIEKLQACKELRELILYKKLNLAKFPYPLSGPFQAIFCRNVMIYFEDELRQKLVEEFERLLMPGGYLFIGHSESLSALKHNFDHVQPATFRKKT